ncbi:MAG TPA: LCP family protein [Candidatus Limnocylindrales bacterium]|nr:LCP family protein [Candidatus Limnocylindrales bacterium]
MAGRWLRSDRSRWWIVGAVLGVALLLLTWRALTPSAIPAAITPSTSPTPTERPTASPTPRPTPTDSPSPSPSPTPGAGFEDGRLTVLVLGSDSSAQRAAVGAGGLTDGITVVSVREDGTGLTIISLPRDTSDVPMPDGGIWTGKLNALAPTLGAEVAADAIGLLLGVQIDNYVQIDMDDLVRIVDAVGGVSIDVPSRLADSSCVIEPGVNQLNGSLALCYARHRQTDDDYARAGRHQLLLLAIRDAMFTNEVDVASLVASLGSLQTNLSLDDLDSLAEVAAQSQGAEAQRVVLGPPDYTLFVGIAGERGWISTPNVAAIQSRVAELLAAD